MKLKELLKKIDNREMLNIYNKEKDCMKVIKIRQQTKHCTDTTRCPTTCAEH